MDSYEKRLEHLNSSHKVNAITQQVIQIMNELKNKTPSKLYCTKHNEIFRDLWENQLQCISCYEDYINQTHPSFEPDMSNEYYNLMKDSE